MPHPSKQTDDPRKRVLADAVAPIERTPAEMLAVLTKVLNREVETINTLTKAGTVPLDVDRFDDFAKVLDQVIKLSREDRLSNPPSEPEGSPASVRQLMEAQKKG